MKFKDFLEMYDNWNGVVVVSDDNLRHIAVDKGYLIYENHPELYEKEVVAFGFYDEEFCVRVR